MFINMSEKASSRLFLKITLTDYTYFTCKWVLHDKFINSTIEMFKDDINVTKVGNPWKQ